MLLDTACAEQTHAGDGFQRPLVPRVRFQPYLMRGVRCFKKRRQCASKEVNSCRQG